MICLYNLETQENEKNNQDNIRNFDIELELKEYYEDYEMYDDENPPDLTKSVDRIAASSNADYSSGSVKHLS